MRKCNACGSTNITEINQDNDYSSTSYEFECYHCGHVGLQGKFLRQPKSKFRYNYDQSKAPFRIMGKTG